MIKLPQDSFAFGLIAGIVFLALGWLLFSFIRLLIVNHYGDHYMLAAPRVELFTILLNVIIFRFMLIKFNREQTGRGVLLITVIASLVYFYFFYRYHISF